MIYFDNAATTFPKPDAVAEAMFTSMKKYCANPGRGGHAMSFETASRIYETRKSAAAFFGIENPANVIFTKNCTESLNFVLKGLAVQGGHFICSSLDHNAVVRPLEAMSKDRICDYSIARVSESDEETVKSFQKLIRHSTIALVCTGASNVFGKVLPVRKLARLAHENGLLFILDAAQTAGTLPINCKEDGIDFLCCAGHKGLYGPMGTGLLLINCADRLHTICEGGTGSFSAILTQPENYPDRLESGTLNVPGIIALGEGIKFVARLGEQKIYHSEKMHILNLYESLRRQEKILLYTNLNSKEERFVPLLSFNIRGIHSEQTAALLAADDIAVRAGLHCAPLAHAAYHTQELGTVRVAPSVFTQTKDVNLLLNSIIKIAKTN